MRAALVVTIAIALTSPVRAQGRPPILRGSGGVAFPHGRAAEIWTRGVDGSLALSFRSWGRTALRVEGAYARFPVDHAKLRARHGIPSSESISVDGGARHAVSALALLETYVTGAGECPPVGLLPGRLYVLAGLGYAGLLSDSYSAQTPSSTFTSSRQVTHALGLGAGLGAEWPRGPSWSILAEGRFTGWWDFRRRFDSEDHWISVRVGVAWVL